MMKKTVATICAGLLAVLLLTPFVSVRAEAAGPYFISDIKISYGDTMVEAKKALMDQGYIPLVQDLNSATGNAFIIIGYKRTKDAKDAIRDIAVIPTKQTIAVPTEETIVVPTEKTIVVPAEDGSGATEGGNALPLVPGTLSVNGILYEPVLDTDGGVGDTNGFEAEGIVSLCVTKNEKAGDPITEELVILRNKTAEAGETTFPVHLLGDTVAFDLNRFNAPNEIGPDVIYMICSRDTKNSNAIPGEVTKMIAVAGFIVLIAGFVVCIANRKQKKQEN